MRISLMRAEGWQNLPPLLYRLWAGLECGVLAGAVGSLWFAFHALVHGDFWWSKFNIAAGWFYDMVVYHAGLSWVTLAGAAVLMLFYCFAGVVFALGWGAFRLWRTFLAVPCYVAVVHLFATLVFWPSFGPFARLWFPWTATAPVHFALFVILMRFPVLYRRLAGESGCTGRPAPEPSAQAPDQAGAPRRGQQESPSSSAPPPED